MSILNQIQQQQMFSQPVMPYTFTTGELDALKSKLQNAENQLMNNPKPNQVSILQMSIFEIKTLLKMIEMTYLQGLGGSGMLPNLSSRDISTVNNNNSNNKPPGNYVCRKCHIPGHFIQDCPNANGNNGMIQKNQNMPPPNYVCRKCNMSGHWIQNCTTNQRDYSKPAPSNYVCHRCGLQGHWIKNCPTNENPSYDNGQSMSSMQDDNNNSNHNNMQQNNANSNGRFQKRFVKKIM